MTAARYQVAQLPKPYKKAPATLGLFLLHYPFAKGELVGHFSKHDICVIARIFGLAGFFQETGGWV